MRCIIFLMFSVVFCAVFLCSGGAEAQNLLPNPSFEQASGDEPAGWRSASFGGHAKFAVAQEAKTGQNSLSLSSILGADCAWGTSVAVRPNTEYKLTGWIKTIGVRPQGFGGAKGAMLKIHNIPGVHTEPLDATNQWTQVEKTFNSGKQTKLIVSCALGAGGNTIGKAFFDDVQLLGPAGAVRPVAPQPVAPVDPVAPPAPAPQPRDPVAPSPHMNPHAPELGGVAQPHVDKPHQTLGSLMAPGAGGATQAPAPKVSANLLAIPSSATQSKIVPLVVEVFELDPKRLSAMPPKERSDVARSMLREAKNTSDDVNTQYVMFRKSCEIAAKAGDLPGALSAIDEIASRFKGDREAMRIIMTQMALKSGVLPESRASAIELAIPVIDEAIANDKYREADKISTDLLGLASKVPNPSFRVQVAERRKVISQKQKEYAKVASAMRTLKTAPDDPDANTVVGTHLCLKRGEWDEGLLMLIKGSDAKLKAAAVAEKANPTDPMQQMKVGDLWYDAAEGLDEDVEYPALAHAKTWYDQCQSKLSGLHKVKIGKRLENIAVAATKLPKGTPLRPKFPCKGVLVAASDSYLSVAINGEIVDSDYSGAPVRIERTFNAGDTVIVRVRRSYTTRAFAAALKFENFPTVFATGKRGSGWMSYKPNPSSYYWYKPGNGVVSGRPLAVIGNASAPVVVSNIAGVRCGPIWGNYETSPTSTYSAYSYLILKVQ